MINLIKIFTFIFLSINVFSQELTGKISADSLLYVKDSTLKNTSEILNLYTSILNHPNVSDNDICTLHKWNVLYVEKNIKEEDLIILLEDKLSLLEMQRLYKIKTPKHK